MSKTIRIDAEVYALLARWQRALETMFPEEGKVSLSDAARAALDDTYSPSRQLGHDYMTKI